VLSVVLPGVVVVAFAPGVVAVASGLVVVAPGVVEVAPGAVVAVDPARPARAAPARPPSGVVVVAVLARSSRSNFGCGGKLAGACASCRTAVRTRSTSCGAIPSPRQPRLTCTFVTFRVTCFGATLVVL
jgi:hypothetical protein